MSDDEKPFPSTVPGNAVPKEDWREIAQQASQEQDPDQLLRLVRDLCNTLDQGGAGRKRKPPSPA